MLKKRYILVPLITLFFAAFLAIGSLGYFVLTRGGDDPAISEATPVGVPNGPTVTSMIGPLGGSITSSDGRITVTVPPNRLTGPVQFAITPITNQAPGGVGNAYRLEPNGQKFTAPVELGFKYSEQELEDAKPESLMASYQERSGGWRMLTNESVDEAGKSLMVATTHFTDMSLGRKYGRTSADKWDPSTYPIESRVASHFRVSPAKATIHPGESVRLDFIGCEPESTLTAWRQRLLRKWNMQTAEAYCYLNDVGYVWNTFYVKAGTGSVEPNFGLHALYTAPSKKPTPNVVGVEAGVMFNQMRKPVRVNDAGSGFFTFHVVVEGSEITIVDQGYKATGAAGTTTWSGVICDIQKPFKIKSNNPFYGDFEFTPSTSSGGLWKTSMRNRFTGGGGGGYTLEGPDDLRTGMVMNGSVTGCLLGHCGTGTGPLHLSLTPLDGNEGSCGE